MIIKRTQKGSYLTAHPAFAALLRLRKSMVFGAGVFILLLAAVSLCSVYYGIQLNRSKRAESFDDFLDNVLQARLNIIPNYIRGTFLSEPERLIIDIKHKYFQKLAYKRQLALERGILLTSPDDFVPAQIRYKGKIVRIKMRLKGDWTDHLFGDKWSFRIKVRRDNTLFGMKQFSLHTPRARNYIYEWLYHQALKREGLVSLRYEFVNVVLNGKDLGVYALEEHFEKRLIEHNKFREGPIIKLNENIRWADLAAHHLKGDYSPTGLQSENVSDIDVFKTNTVLSNPVLYKQFLVAQSLLEAFRYRELPTHKVFDAEKLAKFFAISDLFGSEHALMWQNLRFYYNPVTSLLEPIGFDANAGHKVTTVTGAYRTSPEARYKFKEGVFNDPVFYRQYTQTLQRISEGAYLEEFFEYVGEALEDNLEIIYKEFPYFHFNRRLFFKNQEIIRHALNPVRCLHAYYEAVDGKHLQLQLGNIQGLPLEIVDVSFKDAAVFKPEGPIIVYPTARNVPLRYQTSDFTIPHGFAWNDTMRQWLTLSYKILGSQQVRTETVHPWPRTSSDFVETDFLRQPANYGEVGFIAVNETTKEIRVIPGDWTVEENVIIPKGYRFICGEGTRLNLTNDAIILSYSPIDFRGSEESRIVIDSSDSTGQGIVVLSANGESILDYVVFENLSSPSKQGWSLTGSVTFYESPVRISRCRFANNHSEDALNIIRSEFTIQNTEFIKTPSDAFDADFSSGSIVGTLFSNIGNDAVDISGSVVEITDSRVINAGDKGWSVGENSRLIAKNNEIISSEIAVASKDLSSIAIDNLRIVDCKVGFTVYQKKSEFDGAEISVKHLRQKNIDVLYLMEEGSKLTIDGKSLSPNQKKVEEILYGVEFGKSR